MTRFLTLTAAMALAGTTAFAQTTTQTADLGASGNPAYPDQIQGADGIVYNCLPGTMQLEGETVRQCQRADGVELGGLNNGAAVGAAAAGAILIAVIADDDDDDSSATTTTE